MIWSICPGQFYLQFDSSPNVLDVNAEAQLPCCTPTLPNSGLLYPILTDIWWIVTRVANLKKGPIFTRTQHHKEAEFRNYRYCTSLKCGEPR